MTMLLKRFLQHPHLIKGAALWSDTANEFTRAPGNGSLMREVNGLMQKANIIVIEVEDAGNRLGKLEKHVPLAPPFPVCWFEMLTKDHSIPIFLAEDNTIKGGAYSGPVGMLMHETAPGVYDMFVLEMIGTKPRPLESTVPLHVYKPGSYEVTTPTLVGSFAEIESRGAIVTVYRNINAYTDQELGDKNPPSLAICNRWLQLVNAGVMAVEHVKDLQVLVPRADRPHKKRVLEIRRIVRILPKRLQHKAPPLTPGGVVDWSHRWEVRGHWRKVHTLGKDRAGDYVVPGYTWVNNFVKGPPEKELVVKTRVLEQPHGEPST